ncbi:OTU-domain-containing protein [Jackrogersella minutella]|nr:OTU-domain-containing protein [Jackrogersella minutella]
MKIRYKAPSGGGMLELDDDAVVTQLLDALKSSTGLADFAVKYGWPPKALSTDQGDVSVQSLGLHRENLTIAPVENSSTASAPSTAEPTTAAAQDTAAATSNPKPSKGEGLGIKDQQISVPMPETGSTLVLRVMPDDNSCLFTAVGGALLGLRPELDEATRAPSSLRRVVTSHILANPTKYTAGILGRSPASYCANMQRPDVWGGDIELSVISEIFGLEIAVVDVKTGTLYRIGEGNKYPLRCVLVYSSVHYDRVAEIFVEGQAAMEFDVTRWPVDSSDHVIAHAQQMCQVLKDKHHYYTDTSDFVVQCNQCDWIGQGQNAVVEHSKSTGHTSISEIKDTN